MSIDYKITQDNIMIKTYIRQHLEISAKAMTKLKTSGIFLNGEHAFVTRMMKKGDVLTLVPEISNKTKYEMEDIPIDILYEDENYLILDKAPFMTVYPAGKYMTGSLLNAVAFHRKNMVFRPIYRLDRNTSGIIVIAKNKIASVSEIHKTYLAVCEGICEEKGVIDSKIQLEKGSRIKRTVGEGKFARTDFERISHSETHSLLKIVIHTGRTHQIRVHFASLGFALAGDDLYGGKTDKINRQALHCHKICIKNKALGFNKEIISQARSDIRENFADLFKVEG